MPFISVQWSLRNALSPARASSDPPSVPEQSSSSNAASPARGSGDATFM